MSRAYRINWVTVGRTVEVRDEIRMDVALLGILPEGEMVELLRDALRADGWKQREDGSLASPGDAVDVALGADGRSVTLKQGSQQEVREQGVDAATAAHRLDARAQRTEAELKAGIARKLAAAEPDVRASVDAAVQRAYVEALKKKAAQMGRVESVQESRGEDGGYEVTIKVRT